ncbi:MAG: CHRD domain-containing protein [Thermosynechococcaceae cyanobacterium]
MRAFYLIATPIIVTGSLLIGLSPRAIAGPSPLFAVLLGGNETAGGDTDGIGSATVTINRNKGRLCYGITVTGIDTPTLAHIHQGDAGVAGGVVVPLTPPASGNPGASSGCVVVAAALLKSIESNPSGFYFNVHTAAFPGGALRGQLF